MKIKHYDFACGQCGHYFGDNTPPDGEPFCPECEEKVDVWDCTALPDWFVRYTDILDAAEKQPTSRGDLLAYAKLFRKEQERGEEDAS